jgi:hypothetical protein
MLIKPGETVPRVLSRTRLPSFLALVLTTAACETPKSFEPQFTQKTDELQVYITSVVPVRGVSGSREVTWHNTGPRANVSQLSQLIGGIVTFSIRDANGTVVHRGNLADNGSFRSASGAPGDWTIRVEASRIRGTVSVRVQRAS